MQNQLAAAAGDSPEAIQKDLRENNGKLAAAYEQAYRDLLRQKGALLRRSGKRPGKTPTGSWRGGTERAGECSKGRAKKWTGGSSACCRRSVGAFSPGEIYLFIAR